ncbi:MAG: ArnT family glycosyltransferase, partial [Planctomycetota bacterium]
MPASLWFTLGWLGLAAVGSGLLVLTRPQRATTASEPRSARRRRQGRRARRERAPRDGPGRPIWPWALLAVVLGLSLWAYLGSRGGVSEALGNSVRWPPIGTLATGLSHALLGRTEIAARFPPIALYLLTGVYVFRIVAAAAGRSLGVAAAIACLAMPVLFASGHLATREAGGAMVVTAGVFYMLRHLRTGNAYDLGLAALAVLVGYLQRRPAVVLLALLPGIAILARFVGGAPRPRLARGWRALWLYGGALVATVWAALPWPAIARTVRPYELTPGNWLDWELASAYARGFPAAIGWPATALAALGLGVAIWSRRTWQIAAVLWLLAVYVLFTTDDPFWVPPKRFVTLMTPAL